MANMIFYKSPGAVLDYLWDWSKWMVAGDQIASAVVTVPAGITLDHQVSGTDDVTAWLTGGTLGATYEVSVEITTAQGRKDKRTVSVTIVDR